MNKKVLLVASAGGHWKELLILKPAFDNCYTHYITTLNGLPELSDIPQGNYTIVQDCNLNEFSKTIHSFFQIFNQIRIIQPDTIITTGAAPGLLAIFVGRIYQIKTIWIDSLANYERLSLSGRIACNIATIVLTQWPHLAKGDRVRYVGAVL